MDVGGLLELAVLVVGLAGIGGFASAVLRSRNLRDSFELTHAANQELRDQIDAHEKRAEQTERRCDERIAALQGQVDVLQGTIVDELVRKVEAGIERATDRAVARAGSGADGSNGTT